MKKLLITIITLILLSTTIPVNAESKSISTLFDADVLQIDEYTTVEKSIISSDPLTLTLDFTTSSFRAIFIISEEMITRIDYLEFASGNIYSKMVNDIVSESDKVHNLTFSSKNELQGLLDQYIINKDVSGTFVLSEYINRNYIDEEEVPIHQQSEDNSVMSIDYYSIALSRFKSFYGENYFNALRHTLSYRGHTGRVYETATSNVSRRWTLDQIFTPGTAVSVIALALGWPYETIRQVVTAVIGIGQVLYTIHVNNVIDWNGTKYYQKNVNVNGTITWKTFAEFKANGVLIIDADKGSSALWSNGTMSYFDGKSYYDNNTGLIQKGIDNYINLGY